MLIGLAAGAAVNAWRRNISSEIRKIHELLLTELATDAEQTRLAQEIIKQYERLGYTGRLLNSGAYSRMCSLCAANGAKSQQFPQFYESLYHIRQTLRCTAFGKSDAYV